MRIDLRLNDSVANKLRLVCKDTKKDEEQIIDYLLNWFITTHYDEKMNYVGRK